MDGYVQTAIGITVSVLLFWLSYRQTIGAKKERTKNANSSVHTSIMRRMVLEDYTPKYKDISRVLEGKAREFTTTVNDMLSEEQVLNSVYTEVFNSDLIAPDQRLKIERKLDYLFESIEEKTTNPTIQEFKNIKEQQKRRNESVFLLTLIVSILGAFSSVLYGFLTSPSTLINFNTEWLLSAVGVFVISILMITLSTIFRREKEESSIISQSSTKYSGVLFQIEVAKTIEKSGYEYITEPKIGAFIPDFIINNNDKTVAIEAKSWKEVIPLSVLKNTIRKLEALSEEDGIDNVILVTKNSSPVKGILSKNSKVKIYTISDFYKYLKKGML